MTLNPALNSYHYSNLNNPKSRKVVINKVEEYNLVYSFRYFNPEMKRFTWRRQHPLKRSDYFIVKRLDYFHFYRYN